MISSAYMTDYIWTNNFLSINRKTRIYKTETRPVMAYTAETRSATNITQRQLDTQRIYKIEGKAESAKEKLNEPST